MRRLGAVALAVALVLGAVAARAALDDDGGDGGGRGGDGRGRLVCAEELRDVCRALSAEHDVVIEEATATADRLAAATDVDLDAWVTLTPWPAIVDEARSRAGLEPLFPDAAEPLAHTRLAIVGPSDLDGCGWRCLGDRAAEGLRVGSRPLATTGLGVLTASAAAGGWFDSSTFPSNDFDAEFDRWLAGLAGAVEPSTEPVRRLLQGPFFDVAVDLEAAADRALSSASADRSAGLTLQYPAPVVTIEAVIATAPDGSAGDVGEQVRESLLGTGWAAPSDAPLGLPAPGVLVALRGRLR